MKNVQNTAKKIAATLLLALLLFPMAFNFFHHFTDHQHIECSENKLHIHQSVSGCDICDFNLLSFNYNITHYSDLKQSEISVELNIAFEPLQLNSFTITNTQLRAPPFFS